jgi:hypothetical protein
MDPWWRGVPFFIAGSQLHLKHVWQAGNWI